MLSFLNFTSINIKIHNKIQEKYFLATANVVAKAIDSLQKTVFAREMIVVDTVVA